MPELIKLRLIHNLTQKKLAEETHCSQQAISKIERGLRNPSMKQLIRIANYFNVTTDSILGRANES